MPDTIAPDRLRPQDPKPVPSGPLDDARRVVVPGRLLLQPAAAMARLALRGDALALGAAFGLALPTQPCRATQAEERSALWLGPDEWLLLGPPGTLDAGTAVPGASVVDIGHRQVGLVLDGPGAMDALAAGCPLDLHPTAFPVSMCTRTVFGKAEVMLWRRSAERFHLEVWRSFAAYVHGLLERAAAA